MSNGTHRFAPVAAVTSRAYEVPGPAQGVASACALTGFIKVSALCEAYGLPLSAHTAPALHAHVCCAYPPVAHIEYFHDHTRIEEMLLDGSPTPQDGVLVPDSRRPGLGLELKEQDAEEFAVKAGKGQEGERRR
jgi:L-alanine-DL-glutamate epimerase-like enolase superfamily enzyme